MTEYSGAVHQAVDERRLIDLAVRLTQQPSQQTALFEREPEVLELIRGPVLQQLEQIDGLQIEFDGMANLIARLPGPTGRRPLVMVGYAMTAQAGQMANPFSGELKDGQPFGIDGPVLWGRGVCEQKAALAAMLEAIRAVVHSRAVRQRPVVLIISTAGETGRHDSVRAAVEHLGLKEGMGVVGLGTDLQTCLANKGRIDVLVNVYGQVCHSSVPWQGVNAIEGMRRVLNRIQGLEFPREHSLLGRGSLAPIHLRSFPDFTHTVQGLCHLTLDRRLLPGDDPHREFDALTDLICSDSSLGAPFRVEVEWGPFMYPSEVPADADVVQLIGASAEAAGCSRPVLTHSHQALDAGYLNHVGIETVMFAPGDVKWAHTDNELASVQQIVDAAKIYAQMMVR